MAAGVSDAPGGAPRQRWRLGFAVVSLCLCACQAWCAETPPRIDYEQELRVFFDEVDRAYPFFDLKGLKPYWAKTKERLLQEAHGELTDRQFLGLVVEAIACLNDSHMWVHGKTAEVPPRAPKYFPGLSFMPASRDRVVVMWTGEQYASDLPPGTVVTSIDGNDARTYLEQRALESWPGSFCSGPQRARLYEYRIPLRGEKGDTHRIGYLKNGRHTELEIVCEVEARGWPHTYNLPKELQRVGRTMYHTQLPSGFGYVYIRKVDGDLAPNLGEVVAAHPGAKGWIVDIRGNGGGGFARDFRLGIEAMPRPVACLIDAGCISAGETLAYAMGDMADAMLFGSRTAGASSAKRTWEFPSGIASIKMSTRSRWCSDGTPVEYNGIVPDVWVEAEPEEVAQGLNSCILRAEEYLSAFGNGE